MAPSPLDELQMAAHQEPTKRDLELEQLDQVVQATDKALIEPDKLAKAEKITARKATNAKQIAKLKVFTKLEQKNAKLKATEARKVAEMKIATAKKIKTAIAHLKGT